MNRELPSFTRTISRLASGPRIDGRGHVRELNGRGLAADANRPLQITHTTFAVFATENGREPPMVVHRAIAEERGDSNDRQ